MKMAALRLYVRVVVSGILLLAAVVLLILQWGNYTDVTLYGPSRPVNTLLLMLCSAVGGVVAWALLKTLWHGVRGLRRLRRAEQTVDELDGIA